MLLGWRQRVDDVCMLVSGWEVTIMWAGCYGSGLGHIWCCLHVVVNYQSGDNCCSYEHMNSSSMYLFACLRVFVWCMSACNTLSIHLLLDWLFCWYMWDMEFCLSVCLSKLNQLIIWGCFHIILCCVPSGVSYLYHINQFHTD